MPNIKVIGCVYSTGTGTENFALRVLATSLPKNLKIIIFKRRRKKKFRDQAGFEPITTHSSPSPLSHFFQLHTSYHYNTNPSSPTVAKTQTPCYQPITETQTPTTSLTSGLIFKRPVLTNSYNFFMHKMSLYGMSTVL